MYDSLNKVKPQSVGVYSQLICDKYREHHEFSSMVFFADEASFFCVIVTKAVTARLGDCRAFQCKNPLF